MAGEWKAIDGGFAGNVGSEGGEVRVDEEHSDGRAHHVGGGRPDGAVRSVGSRM